MEKERKEAISTGRNTEQDGSSETGSKSTSSDEKNNQQSMESVTDSGENPEIAPAGSEMAAGSSRSVTIKSENVDTGSGQQPRAAAVGEQNGPLPGISPRIKLADLRLSQDFGAEVSVKKILTTVPVGKPQRHTFFRVHPSESYRMVIPLIELKEERETYLVDPRLGELVANEAARRLVVTVVTRQGVVSLWPLRLPDDGKRLDAWSTSAMDAAERAKTRWVRMAANMNLGAYEIAVATGDLGDPSWPEESFEQLVNIAFRDRYITDPDDPVLLRLRGAM